MTHKLDGDCTGGGCLTANGAVMLLAGKRPRPGTIIDELTARVTAAGRSVYLELPHRAQNLGKERWIEGAVIVHRGLSRAILEQLREEEAKGWRMCNRAAASLLALDRPELMARLRADGVPVPHSQVLADWSSCQAASEGRNVVVKAADGSVGRGERIVFGGGSGLPIDQPFEGPYLVEERVTHDGMDRKLYVAGDTCFGLLKPWPRTQEPDVRFDPPTDLREIAFDVGLATGLEIFGVDVVMSPGGPVVVDVNVFPGFRGIEGAGEAVARHVMRLAGRPDPGC
ncbi:ribosomal protein S6--L-glutamate ligase [Palleronia marisminoris]|uniref:Ribosomal protein S6 modification protein n=1 Tax=Palleronia marisminoris TaxID=315423 RepID=A0A1Y5RR66_9RHOB|nr:hypothetical protein [Palleronia marisminoris]SFG27148.1 ribosomal protein S6--L-glutamate ligase [Palleronia marisminoris]SLN20581.1 Ribosomal protein S6 modification protein [Palleronia marisminoris]